MTAAVLAAGLALAAAVPAQADSSSDVPSTWPAPYGQFVIASQPSQHCGYYHWIYNGANIGDGYRCSSVASLNTYHVWVVCSNRSQQYQGPTVGRGTMSGFDCSPYTPKVGGFDRDS